MGKRSNFERVEKDFYRTFDPRAVAALAPHLAPNTKFAEPCAGDGVLIDQLEALGHVCTAAYDLQPNRHDIVQSDVLRLGRDHMNNADCAITNPPWSRPLLHGLLRHFQPMMPSWFLWDANWVWTRQSAPFIPGIKKIVAIGRLKWMEGTTMDAKDDCAWFYSEPGWTDGPTLIGRAAK